MTGNKKKKKKRTLKDFMKTLVRKSQSAQGYYDGRYKTRAVPDKKKQASKRACRRKGKKLDE